MNTKRCQSSFLTGHNLKAFFKSTLAMSAPGPRAWHIWIALSTVLYCNEKSCLLTLSACTRVTVVIVCVSVTMLAATYLVCMSKVRHHRVPCRLLKICIVWSSLKMFCSGDIA